MSARFEALWEALAQYVQNTEDVEGELDERGLAMLGEARAMLEEMDRAVIAAGTAGTEERP